MGILAFLAFTVYAAETIISPLPDDMPAAKPVITKPDVSFSDLLSYRVLGQVLGASTTPTPSPTPTAIPTAPPMFTRKKSFTIALLGDSMIDTLGPDVTDLQTRLSSSFPSTHFTLLNYGVGGTNIEYGLERISNDYDYLGRHVPSLISQHPDIVVVESFGYNPLPDGNGIDRHWLDLASIVDKIKASLPNAKIIIAATIAPNATVFGDGAAGVSFSPIDKWQRVDVIKKYLDSTVKFAQSEHFPLADAFHPSLGADGNGNLSYINAGDHIHTSPAGRAFFAQVITNAIINNHLLE